MQSNEELLDPQKKLQSISMQLRNRIQIIDLAREETPAVFYQSTMSANCRRRE